MIFWAVLLANTQTVTYNCPEGWVTDVTNKRCYKFNYYPKQPYVLAARDCAESHASLLSVTTSTEHSFINNYLMSYDLSRIEWFTSGKKESSNVYIWEGDGLIIRDITPVINFWMPGYQFVPEDRMIYKFDYNTNEYRWYIGANTLKRSYICEIGQEDAYRVLIQRRDFTFGTPYLNEDQVSIGPTFDPDGVPENIWYLKTTTSLYLECLAIGHPQPVYRWLRGPTDTSITEEVQSSTDDRYTLTNGKLTITNPDDQDSQYYMCEASNSEGTIISNFASLSLGKLGEFSNVADAPVTSYEFEGAVIECSKIMYEPTIVYNWERDIGKIEDIFQENNAYIFISSNGRLYFSEVNENDAGKYYCRVSLSGISRTITGSAQPPSAVSRPILLKVERQAAKADWGPIFQDDFINVFPTSPGRGSDVRLECFAYGTAIGYKTSWSFVWTREGGLPNKVKFENLNRVLIIQNAQAEDEGKYTCEVTRGSNRVSRDYSLVLQTKPYFIMPLSAQHIDVGSQLTWQCLADGNPSPTYSWYYNGVLIQPSDPRFLVRRNILIISNADPKQHEGMYQCGATNSRGQILSSAQLRVLAFAPTFAKKPLPAALSGAVRGNITIPCQPEGSPRPVIKWSRRSLNGGLGDISVSVNTGQPVDSTAKFEMTLNGDLIIRDITQSDAGDYVCTATNDQGEDNSACRLEVQSGTTLSQKPLTQYNTYYQNDTLFIRCEASYDKDLDLIYVWKFNGKMIDMEKESYFYTQSYNPVGLYIKPLQYYHEGVYECTALTPLNSQSASGKVFVKGVPQAPSGIYADSGKITTNSVILFWTSGSDRGNPILEYDILANVATEPGEWYRATRDTERIFHVDTAIPDTNVGTEKRTYRLTSLLPGNNYAFKIRAKNIKGWGEYSIASAYYQTRHAAPDLDYNQIHLNLTGGGGSVGDLTIRWHPLPVKYHGGPGLYYTLFIKRTNTDGWTAVNVTATKDDIEKKQLFHVKEVGVRNYYLPYDVMIMPGNNYGRGDNSTKVTIYSAMDMPGVSPVLSHCYAINSTAMDVYWTPIENTREKVGGRIAGFQVNYWTTQPKEDKTPIFKKFIRFNLIDGVVPTHGVVIGLKINHYSTFDVQVFNSAGLGPKSDPYNCETANDPTHHYPTEVRVHPSGSTSVEVTWRGVLITTDEATVIGYKIFLWPSNENFRTAFEYYTNFSPTKHTLNNLEQGVVYALRLSAVSDAGDGQKSPTVYFAIAGGPATLIDQTVTEFSFLSGSSITSSIVLISIATIFVFFMS